MSKQEKRGIPYLFLFHGWQCGLGLPLVDPLHVSLEGRVRAHFHRAQVTGVGVRVREMLRFNMVPKHNRHGIDIDQISIKTSNPKCLIEFINWRYSQSCWYSQSRPLL
jgi:hypothetical protein